jgi:hypothetical protein
LQRSANADAVFNQDWARVLAEQLTALIRSNVDAMGLRKPSEGSPPVRMLDYACGFGMASMVSPLL